MYAFTVAIELKRKYNLPLESYFYSKNVFDFRLYQFEVVKTNEECEKVFARS